MRPTTTLSMLVFGVLGTVWTVVYWNGLVAWYRFCSLPFEQVKGTPYEGMWTSLRGATGVLFLMMVLMWAMTVWRYKRHQARSSSNQHLQPTPR